MYKIWALLKAQVHTLGMYTYRLCVHDTNIININIYMYQEYTLVLMYVRIYTAHIT